MELEGQVAIVTGAGRGIGRAIALELASMGAGIVAAELNQENGERTAAEVRALGRTALAIRTDVTRAADPEAMVRRTMEEFGRLDILVNNAGIYRSALPTDVTEEHWDAIMNVNAKAVFFCSQAALPHMLAVRRGNIISVASMAAKVGNRLSLPYCASKAAVASITRSLAVAYAGDGIRANCVCPGQVDTDMWAQIDREVGVGLLGMAPGEYFRQRSAQIPLGRVERPEDVANVVGFLASSKSSYMTGQAINVTGGQITY